MSENKGLMLAGCSVLAVPFAIVPAALLVAGSQQTTPAGCTPGSPALSVNGPLPTVDSLTPAQVETAAIIMKVAENLKLPYQAQIIGIITAKQESDLGADTGVTGPSDAGVFQQRTLPGWYGTRAQVEDPAYGAEKFFLGHDIDYAGPGSAGPPGYHLPGLVDIPGWETMRPTEAAQAVQGSAFPEEYQKHVPLAEDLIARLAGIDINTASDAGTNGCTSSHTVASGDVAAVIERGKSIIGTPYDFGGGSMDGPGPGGIDCSAFVAYAWTAAGYRDLPRVAQAQYDFLSATPVALPDIQPGDLVFEAWGRKGTVGSPNAVSHVTMYIGNDQIIEASRSKNRVDIAPARFNVEAFVGIRRIPHTPQKPPK